ncbi:alpha/beta hydrolase-fold protein [Sphingomonas sp. ASV193]|uniref:alpha/beta hydrolase n=1 Tax=Sphingomonas sp. ASV193 TaxID=3144405 RepID=UPI0032E93365
MMIAAALAALVAQPSAGTPIVLGQGYTMAAPTLGGRYAVNVVLPDGYATKPGARYPVLYIIDGGVAQDLIHIAGVEKLGAAWGRSRDAIVVGIETKDRRRELTGPVGDPETRRKYPTAGGSAAFRAFIAERVKPFVTRRFRTNGQDAVIGESLAGLFIVETWLRQPALFGAYGAIDPSLWWDKEALSKVSAGLLAGRATTPPLYLAWARETSEEPGGLNRFLGSLDAHGGRRCLNQRLDLGHSTIYQQLSPQALQFLLPPASPPPPEFGFEVQCSKKS